MIRDLPAEAMDRLTIENDRLEKCEDNGKTIQVDEGITTICHRAFQGRPGPAPYPASHHAAHHRAGGFPWLRQSGGDGDPSRYHPYLRQRLP